MCAQALALGSARGQQPILPAGVDVNCNWSTPLPTNIPDSRSSTCAGALPNGSTYLLGSQLPRLWDRDPLTLALSPDGAAFDSLQAVRADAPAVAAIRETFFVGARGLTFHGGVPWQSAQTLLGV